MTYEEAMRLAKDEGRILRRPEWDPGAAISFILLPEGEDDEEEIPTCVLWDLDNEMEILTGGYENYKPTPEDVVATDWEVYDAEKLFPEGHFDDDDDF